MSYSEVIEGFYSFICRDPDSGEGGLTPTANDFHLGYFQRTKREELTYKTGAGIDRCVQIVYKGTQATKPFISGNKIRHMDRIMVKVGFFAGDHHDDTNMVIHSDDKMLQNSLVKPNNYPDCGTVQIERVTVINSDVVKQGKEQYILELLLEVQTTS